MQAWLTIFLISCFLIFYNYAGYVVFVYLIQLIKGKPTQENEITPYFPTVSFIVAAFNEEDFIEKKIVNSLGQEYPADKIEFIFVTDGSSDGTAEIVSRFPRIHLMHVPERNGKSAAINRAVKLARHDVLIFSDANTTLNPEATARIAHHYQFISTGGVAGEKKVSASDKVGDSEGLYWKYESFLKKVDSDFYSVVGAAGELFSVRRELYEPIGANIILDDFVISLETARKGYRIIYEPLAYATEAPSFSMEEEQKRKIRIAAGGFQAISLLKSLLKWWNHPRLSFLYISHRLLRWMVSPFCLILAFFSNGVLFITTNYWLLDGFFIAQVLFYGMAATARFVPGANKLKLLKVPYYFTFMNISVILGFFRYVRGSQSAIWEKAKRAQPTLINN